MAAAAPAAGKGKRKRAFSEDDVYLLLHRYTPATILTALQEVAQHAERRNIDWRALVAKTTTGITSAREFQMLWRHFAYRHDLAENVDASAQPLGDESDLECEIEPVPTPSNEALAEASGFAKILISGSSREQAHRVNSEAPVLNTPNEKIPRVQSDKQLAQSNRLTNGTGLVSISRQSSHTGLSPDPVDGNGPPKKKKKPKPWSKEEDADLAAGVQKFGEGNWLDILHKCNFDNTRTPVQLSQRWSLICKRQGSAKPANTKPMSVASSEERKAAQKAFSMALDMPMTGLRSGALQQSIQHPSPVFGTMTPEVKSATAPSSLLVPVPLPVPVAVPGPGPPAPAPVPVQVQMPIPQVQQAPAQAAPLKASNTSNKSRSNSKKQAAQPNPTNGPSSIQAAAIAAGGRIATPSVATNLLKAAQSTKAVHIRSRGTGSSKSSTSSKTPNMAGEPGTQLGSALHPEPPNTSAPSSSSVLSMHATEQVHSVSELTGVNHPGQSAGAHLSETKKTLSTTAVSGPCDNVEKDDDSKFCVVTLEDLFPEDVIQPDIVDPKAEEIIDPKDADMLEFDRFVAQGCLNMDYLDKSKTEKIAPEAQGVVGSQKKQTKLLSAVGRSNPMFAGAPAAGKKTKTLVLHGAATSTPTVTSSGIVGAGNASMQNKAFAGRAAAPGTTGRPITVQKQHATNSRSNGMPRSVALGTGAPANRQGNPVVNGASKGHPPASQ